MHNIDYYDDSMFLLINKTPKKIISWITILIFLILFLAIIINIPFARYKKYTGYLIVDKKDFYLQLILEKNDFPINKSKDLYIEGIKYNYNVVEINEKNVILSVNLNSSIEIVNNILIVDVFENKTTVFKMIKAKIKKGFDL